MTKMSLYQARREALFASGLQRSDAPTSEEVAEAIRATLRRLGTAGCTGQMAQEFGDYPEAAAERMRWARQLLAQTPAPPQAAGHRQAASSGWGAAA